MRFRGDPSFTYRTPEWFVVSPAWRHPEHESFTPRNARSLFNAFTAVYREINPHMALRRGETLHGLFDAVVGLS